MLLKKKKKKCRKRDRIYAKYPVKVTAGFPDPPHPPSTTTTPIPLSGRDRCDAAS